MAGATGEGWKPRGMRLENRQARLFVQSAGAAVRVARAAIARAVLRPRVFAAPPLTAPGPRREESAHLRFHKVSMRPGVGQMMSAAELTRDPKILVLETSTGTGPKPIFRSSYVNIAVLFRGRSHSTVYTRTPSMSGYEWDLDKARSNHRKHGVLFTSATAVLEDELAITIRDEESPDEERWVTVGQDDLGRILVVVYAWRQTNIRIISARRATPGERRRYEEP